MVAVESGLFWCLLVAEHGQDGEKEKRWLTQAFKDLLEKDEEPIEPESRVVFSRKSPRLGLRPLRNKQSRLAIPPVDVNQIKHQMTRACFVRYESKTTKQPPRSDSPMTSSGWTHISRQTTRRSFFSPSMSASTVSIRISANRTVVAPHTEAHATSLSLLTLYYYLTLVLTYELHPLSTNNPLTALYLSLIRSSMLPSHWLFGFRSRLACDGLWSGFQHMTLPCSL